MPAIISPSVDPVFPASLVCPLNGEGLDASQEQVLDQAVLDGVEAARLRLYKLSGQRTGCYNSTDILIEPLGAVTLKVGGQWVTYPHLTATTLPTSGLVGGTRYWIYAYSLAGALAFTWSVDAPSKINSTASLQFSIPPMPEIGSCTLGCCAQFFTMFMAMGFTAGPQ